MDGRRAHSAIAALARPCARIPAGRGRRRARVQPRSLHAVRAHPGRGARHGPSIARPSREGRGLRHRRHPARQVHPQGQVRSRVVEGGFGFCDVVYGWDLHDQCYDNTTLTGWHKGFPDALARLDFGTHRKVPWDDHVDFFLGDFVQMKERRGGAVPADGRQVLKRVLKRAEKLGLQPMCGLEFEFFNFIETPQTWAAKQGVRRPTPHHARACSAIRCCAPNHSREYFQALFDDLQAFGVPIEGLHTETGPGRDRGRASCSPTRSRRPTAASCSRRRQGDRRALRHHAELHGEVERASTRAARATCHQALSDGKRNLFHDARAAHGMSKLFEHYLAGQIALLLELAPMYWPTINSYKRLVDGFWAPVKPHLGRRQPHRELPRDRRLAQVDAPRDALSAAPTSIPTSRSPRASPRDCTASSSKLELTRPADHRHQRRRREHPARAALADRDDAHLPRLRLRARLVRRRLRRPLRRHARMGMAPVAGRRDRLGAQALLRDHLSRPGS